MLLLAACGGKRAELTLDDVSGSSELDLAMAYDARSGLAVFANDSGEPGLFLLDTRKPGARPERLPIPQAWPRRPTLSPGGEWLSYHEYRPLEQSHWIRMYLMHLPDRKITQVVECHGKDRAYGASFSPDGKTLAYELSRVPAEGLRFDLVLHDLASHQERKLVSDASEFPASTWDPRGGGLVIRAGGCAVRVDAESGARQQLGCAPDGKLEYGELALAADGRLALPVIGAACTQVGTVEGGSWKAVGACGQDPQWLDGELGYIEVERGVRRGRVGQRSLGAPLDAGVVYQLFADGPGQVVALAAAPGIPRSIWRVRLGQPPALLWSPLPLAQVARLSPPAEQVWLRSSDGLEVPVQLFPPRLAAGQRAPVVLWLHGGPHEDVSPRWYPEIAALTMSGVMVAAVNYRGSTGFGTVHRERAESGRSGDVLAARAWLLARPDVDPARLFMLGESVGGVVAAEVLAAEPRGWRGLVQWCGPTLALALRDPGPTTPPLLMVHGVEADVDFATIAERVRATGWKLEEIARPDAAHAFNRAEDRKATIGALVRFVSAP